MTKDKSAGVRVLNASLTELESGEIILRGSLDPATLPNLKVDFSYQREVLSRSGSGGRKTSRLRKAVVSGSILPDIELGMRGESFTSKGEIVTLHDPVFIVDGLQRISAMLDYAEEGDGNSRLMKPIGATVYFASNPKKESERFLILNQQRIAVSANVILRNMKEVSPGVATLYGLSRDVHFALFERVCWNQRMNKREIINAMVLLKAAISLHRHIVDSTAQAGGLRRPGKGTITQFSNSSRGHITIDRVANHLGLNRFRENIKTFFELIDECWGIRTIEYGEAQGHLKGNFLAVVGSFLSNNVGFWENGGKTLKIEKKVRTRFKSFPVNDPEIRRLAAGGTMVMVTLYQHLLTHMNKHRPANSRYR